MDIHALTQKRARKADAARAINARAKSAARDLTADEAREVDDLLDEVEELDEKIADLEAGRQRERNDDEPGEEPGANEDPPGRRRGRQRGGLTFRTADGSTVRGVTHGERFADAAGHPGTEDLSLGRALVGMITGDRDLMEPELRAQVVGQDPAGGFFVLPELGSRFIDLARAGSVLSQAGAITIPLGAAETRIVRVESDPTAAWKAELKALNSTDVTFSSLQLYPKVLGCVVDISEELVEDGANAAATLEDVLSQAVADQLDRSLFRGVSGGEGGSDVAGRTFTGILDDPNVNTVDLAGAAPTDYDDLVDAIQLVEDANGQPAIRLESPRTAGTYAKLKASDNQPLQPPSVVADLRHLRSTQVPTNLGASEDQSVSVVGNFTSGFVMLGIRSAFRVEVSREAGNAWENLGRKVRVWGRADMAIGRPSHLTLIEGITT